MYKRRCRISTDMADNSFNSGLEAIDNRCISETVAEVYKSETIYIRIRSHKYKFSINKRSCRISTDMQTTPLTQGFPQIYIRNSSHSSTDVYHKQ